MATSTRRHHLSRKELRQPDEFISFLDSAGEYIADNLGRVILYAIATLVVILAGVGWHLYASYQNRLAAESFYQAISALDHKDFKGAIVKFNALEQAHPETDLGRLAQFYVGGANLALHQPAPARQALKAYLDQSDPPAFRELALMQMGVANEELKDYTAAQSSYEEAARMNGPEKGRAQLNAARLMAQRGNKQGAIAAYQRYLRESPDTPETPAVIESLAQLGIAAPAGPATPPELPSSP